MKKYIKRILSISLVAVMAISSACCVNIASAAQVSNDTNENSQVAAYVESQTTPSNTEETTVSVTTEPSTTAPVTQPATQKPTQPSVTVGKVKNIQKTSYENNKISLKWDKVSFATGYKISYCNADKTTKYTYLSSVKSNSCTIQKLSGTTKYYFKIQAYITKNGNTYYGAETVKQTATQPSDMSGVHISRSSSVIEIKWNKNSKANGYYVYRACAKSKNKYVLYKTINSNSTTVFDDKNIEGGKLYYYKVKSYRKLYGSCYYTSHFATVSAVCGLGAPVVSTTTQLNRVSLSWNKNKYASGYTIYYSTSQNGTFKKIGSTKNNFSNTPKLSSNKTYYFKVYPYKSISSKTDVMGTSFTVSKKVSSKAFGKDVGSTYIEISTKQQHMWMYCGGKQYASTDVVTGNDDGNHNTPKGVFKIFQKSSPTTLTGPGYSCRVSYWMAFTYLGCGIHDSSWRSSSEYGGSTYKGNGSHGCVNTPYSQVKKIYSKAKVGTYVIVY